MTITAEVSRKDYSWLSGNARLIELSGQLLGAHMAYSRHSCKIGHDVK